MENSHLSDLLAQIFLTKVISFYCSNESMPTFFNWIWLWRQNQRRPVSGSWSKTLVICVPTDGCHDEKKARKLLTLFTRKLSSRSKRDRSDVLFVRTMPFNVIDVWRFVRMLLIFLFIIVRLTGVYCSINPYSASRDNWCTVGGDGGCRVGEVRAGTTSPMPDHKGFKLQ